MADEKKARTQRSDPPAHPNEVLRASVRGCTESIRNRTGVPDDISQIPIVTVNANESALEFPPEIQGSATATSSTVTGSQPVDAPTAVAGFLSSEPATPLMSSSPVSVQSIGEISGKPVEHVHRSAAAIAKVNQAEVEEDLDFILGDLMDQEIVGRSRNLFEIATVQRDPRKRPMNQRISLNPTRHQIRDVVMNRLARLRLIKPTKLTIDIARREIDQLRTELIEMGILEKLP